MPEDFQSMKELLDKSRTVIAQQQKTIEELTSPAWQIGTIVGIHEKTVVVEGGGTWIELEKPRHIAVPPVGSMVRLNKDFAIVGVCPHVRYGSTGTVTHKEGRLIQVQTEVGVITVDSSMVPTEVGDQVILNASNLIIVSKLLKQNKSHTLLKATNVTWEDIGGLAEAKLAMQEMIEMPFKFPKLFKAFKRKPSKGLLLHGRHGMGKTLLGKAAATSLATLHGKDTADSGFIYVKGPEILTKWVGETEEIIRSFFARAEKHYQTYNYPAIIFFDEADSIFVHRGAQTSSGMQQTIVPQMLSEMDGMVENHAIVMMATNRADMLDPAIIRPGRIDRRILVPAPTTEAGAQEIFTIHMRELPVAETELVNKAAKVSLDASRYPIYEVVTRAGTTVFAMSDVLSGAFIADIVKKASNNAIQRNISKKANSVDGLRWEDFETAFDCAHKEQRGLNHDTEMVDFLERHNLTQEDLLAVKNLIGGSNATAHQTPNQRQR